MTQAMAQAMTGAWMGVLKAGAENASVMTDWRWRKQMEEMGEKSALEAMRTQYEQSATRQIQEQMSRGQEIAMIAKKAAAVKAAATVRAGKAGVSGASVQAQQQQFEKDSLQSIGVRKQEADWADAMAAQQREPIQQQAQSRIEAVQAGPEPSSAGRLMNTLSQAVTGAVQASQFKSGIEAATTPVAPEGYVPSFKTPFGDVPQNWLQAPLESLQPNLIPPSAGLSASMFPHLQTPLAIQQPPSMFDTRSLMQGGQALDFPRPFYDQYMTNPYWSPLQIGGNY